MSEVFSINDIVVYPSHGLGIITDIETQNIGGQEIRVFVIALTKENVTLRVPVKRAAAIGLRAVSGEEYLEKVLSILQSKPKVTKGMWSKRAQEYESKINSGDLVFIAEVIRDLHKNVFDPERSYSERIIYESALSRLSIEFAAIKNIEVSDALEEITSLLNERYEMQL